MARGCPVLLLRVWLARAEDVFLTSLLAAMVLIVNLQVFFRYFLRAPLTWSEEAARLMLIWLAFLSAAVAVREGTNIVVDLVPKRLRGSFLWGYRGLFFSSLAFFALAQVASGVQLGFIQHLTYSPALNLPMLAFTAPVPISAILVLVHLTIGPRTGSV